MIKFLEQEDSLKIVHPTWFTKIKKVYTALRVMEAHKGSEPRFSRFIHSLHDKLKQLKTQNINTNATELSDEEDTTDRKKVANQASSEISSKVHNADSV